MRLKRKSGRGAFWGDDGGFSTLGMAVALLVTLSLVFSAAQVYRVSSASADIQEVADACVLAAEGEVAEFMIAVRVCDAVVLSLSLTSAAMFGLGVVALCAPPAAELGIELVNLGTKVLQARNTFAERAASGLNAPPGGPAVSCGGERVCDGELKLGRCHGRELSRYSDARPRRGGAD